MCTPWEKIIIRGVDYSGTPKRGIVFFHLLFLYIFAAFCEIRKSSFGNENDVFVENFRNTAAGFSE